MSGTGQENYQDFDLVERVLGGCEEALEVIRQAHHAPTEGFLRRSGASGLEAEEIAAELLADCAMGAHGKEPLFRKYTGRSPLGAWLKTVALNVFIDRRRREKRMVSFDAAPIKDRESSGGKVESGIQEEPLLDLMKNALLRAISSRRGSEMVMLHLRYIHGLTQRELADTWAWHESKVSRVLDGAMKSIAADTLAQVKRTDPWLDLQWTDFLELAGTEELSLFAKPNS